MGIPIEPRMPFLDCNVIEFGFKLPPEYLIHHCWHKYIIRKMMLDALPGEVVWRKVKMGFPFDLTGWLTRKKDMIFRLVSGGIPLVDTGRLMNDFEVLKATDPHLLWRYISILFWYKKMILKQDLVPFG